MSKNWGNKEGESVRKEIKCKKKKKKERKKYAITADS